MPIEEGSYVLLATEEGWTKLVKIKRGIQLNTHFGIVKIDEIIGKEFGEYIKTHLGKKMYLLNLTLKDYVYNITRRTQILYPKDIGLILLYCNVTPGSIVVEAGTGSGCLTGILASMVKPNGKVYTYEIREEFIKIARRNIEKLGLEEYVVFKHKDITRGIDEKNVDAVILDMPTPWLVVKHAYKALKGGGVIACFLPTIEQVIKTVSALREEGFIQIEVCESTLRYWKVKRNETRPETFMVAHTGFLVFARKVNRQEVK